MPSASQSQQQAADTKANRHLIPSDRKHYAKRALIFGDKAKSRARKHNRDKSIVYQNWLVGKLGPAYSYLLLDIALVRTRKEFSTLYGQRISAKVGRLCFLIQGVCSQSSTGSFSLTELNQFINKYQFSERIDCAGVRDVRSLVSRVQREHFINPLGHGIYVPTNRLKLFMNMFNKHFTTLSGENFIPDNQ